MSDSAKLWVARHGETVWHAENRYAGGDSDIDLTDLGKQQATDLGVWARSRQVEVVISSPVRRARETAKPSADAVDVSLQVVAGLKEIGFGIAEGRSAAEIEAADPRVMAQFRADPVANPFPEAESARDAAVRGASSLREIAAQHHGRRVLVVAHNTLLRLSLCELLGIPTGQYRRIFPRLENAAITEISIPIGGDGLASLRSLNLPTTAVRS
ncbi:MAG: histidine phosphatase family protein [Allobranchiibius sp.]